MSHFTVVVCLDDPGELVTPAAQRNAIELVLESVMAPWDENREAGPYRSYEDGGPEDYWLYDALKKSADHERAGTGLLPYKPDSAGWSSDSSKETPDEQRVKIAKEAAVFGSLPEPVTWEALLDAEKILYPDDDEGDRRLQIDETDNRRAYRISTYNPESKWDYWSIGGRWSGHFLYRAEFAPEVLTPESGWDSPKAAPLHCDGGRKRALDLAGQREEAAEKARATYREYHALVDHLPEALPWSVFADNVSAGNGYTIDRAREEYRRQPRVQAVDRTDFMWVDDAVKKFGIGIELYAEQARAAAVPGFALVTLAGQWMAPGRMGWFAMSDADDGSRAQYWEVSNAYIEALPDDAWLVALDCHI